MPKQSAGLLMYRKRDLDLEVILEVFLVHPGGPFWANKDIGAWSIPKGEYVEGEDVQEAARREFYEETGFIADGPFLELGTIKQAGGKIVTAWAFEGNCDPLLMRSNLCQIEWPPRSKHLIEIPEVDRGEWFSVVEAQERILKSQQPLLQMLCRVLQHAQGQSASQ